MPIPGPEHFSRLHQTKKESGLYNTSQLINSLIIQGEYFEIPHIETKTCVLASYTSTMIFTFVPDLDIAERQRVYISCRAASP